MEITTLKDYMELVFDVKTVEELSSRDWYEIKMNAKAGLEFDIKLLEMKPAKELAPIVAEQPATSSMADNKATEPPHGGASDLTF